MNDVRITIVKRMINEDLIREYATGGDRKERFVPCPRFDDGQTFVVQGQQKPDGFCSWAWADIQRDVVWVALGGVQPNHTDPGTAIACCTDGLNPVFFRLEPIAARCED
jgi:uncharacterized repeat protein (TIGR04076 family)